MGEEQECVKKGETKKKRNDINKLTVKTTNNIYIKVLHIYY